ncbi:MAG: PAS domain S-box protein, partial [Deltaproteobacteria bacterium]|nr:PAS domain S-box protein [Deltaproteobacteria bacterium]
MVSELLAKEICIQVTNRQMEDQEKTKEQLLYEMTEMRRRIAELEAAVVRSRARDQQRPGGQVAFPRLQPRESFDDEDLLSTQSIDLSSIFTEDVSTSGSFSFSGVDRTWFGKLLHALPMPAFLVDQSGKMLFLNECCRRIADDYLKLVGTPFSSLFTNQWVSVQVEQLLAKVLALRLRESIEAAIDTEGGKIWGRLSMRSIRLGESRSVLVLVENLTLEKEQLLLKQKHADEIQKERDELEQRVQERTAELVTANEQLTKEIADRQLAEEERARSEARYRSLVQNSPVGIISCDAQGNVTDHNPAVLNILGISSEEAALGINLLTHSALVAAGASDTVRRCLESGNPVCREFRYSSANGGQIFARLHVVPLAGNGGRIAGAQAVVEDVSEHRRAQDLLLRSERLRALVELAGSVAHNFNKSLQAVAAYSQTAISCLESGLFSDIGSLLEQIRESARQTAMTVRSLQQFALARSAVRPSQIRVFAASDAVREAVEKSKLWWKSIPKTQGREITLNSDLARDCLIEGDPHEIVEIVENLVKNSVEALPAGGVISVRTFATRGEVVIQVQDDGVGIPKKHMDKIFEPFWTSKPS